jgi:hypothetical protein
MVHGDDPADPDPQPRPAQLARQQGGRGAGDDVVPVTDLARDHQVAGPQVGGQPATRAGHGQGRERLLAQRGRLGAGPARPVAGRHDLARADLRRAGLARTGLARTGLARTGLGRIAQPAPDRPGFQPQRGADQQPGPGHRTSAHPHAGRLEPGHGRAPR